MVALGAGVLGTGINSVSFTSINQDYKDLLLICEIIPPTSNTSIFISFNGNSPAGNRIFLQARSGTRTISSGASTVIAANLPSLERVPVNCSVMGYSATDKGKVALVRSGATDQTSLTLLSQNSTTAITSITINLDGAKLMQVGSQFSLYGIR